MQFVDFNVFDRKLTFHTDLTKYIKYVQKFEGIRIKLIRDFETMIKDEIQPAKILNALQNEYQSVVENIIQDFMNLGIYDITKGDFINNKGVSDILSATERYYDFADKVTDKYSKETEEELKELRELKEIVAENRKLADDIELMKREIEKLEEEIQELIYPTKPLEIDLEIEEIEEEIEVGGFENE